jgi:malate dehydrogenase
MFGYPVTCAGGDYTVIDGLPIDAYSKERIDITLKELEEEKAGVAALLG